MQKHLKILATLYIAFGLLGSAVVASYWNATPVVLPRLNLLPLSSHGFGAILVFLFGAVSVLGIIGGVALLLQKSWGGILILTLGFINLMNLPLGAMLGIYTIWTLMRSENLKLWKSGYDGGYDSRIFPPYHRQRT